MTKIHKINNEGEILCQKVPNHSDGSPNWEDVTCKYCLKLKERK